MDKKYITIFKDISQSIAASAETVMDYNRQKDDEEGLKASTIMRDDFQALADKISEAGDNYIVNKADGARLLIGVMIFTNQLQGRINNLKTAMTGYQTDIIPKLQKIIDSENDETASAIAEKEFIIKEEEKK